MYRPEHPEGKLSFAREPGEATIAACSQHRIQILGPCGEQKSGTPSLRLDFIHQRLIAGTSRSDV